MNPVLPRFLSLLAGVVIGVVCTCVFAVPRHPPSPTSLSCFGSHTVANAQRNGESWVRGGYGGSAWGPRVPRNAGVRCLSITPHDQWAECQIGPVDSAGTRYVMDCDTSEFNSRGCVSGR